MKPSRFDLVVWSILSFLLAAIALVIWRGDRVGLDLTLVSPSRGEAAATTPIVIEFGQVMDAASVEERFSIQPEISGRFIWQGSRLLFMADEAYRVDETYTIRLTAGSRSTFGHELQENQQWRFGVRQPGIAFLRQETRGFDLWAQLEPGGEEIRLTDTEGHVFDFAVAPDGEGIAHSRVNEEKGIDLWWVARDGSSERLLLNCGADRCSSPSWSPDGTRIAYSRAPAGLAPGDPVGPPRIWLLDLRSGETVRLHADTQRLGYGPLWSPDGSRLAYADGIENRLVVIDMQTGEEFAAPSLTGVMGTWSPDGTQMVYYDTQAVSGRTGSLLFRIDLVNQDILPLFDPAANDAEYSGPQWSPDGEWLAVRVRASEGRTGDELWVVPPDGSFGLLIDAEPDFIHADAAWDPWGACLLFQRIQLGVAFPSPQIWLWTRESQSLEQVVENGLLPAWLP